MSNMTTTIERVGLGVVAARIAQECREPGERRLVHAAVLLQALPGAGTEVVVAPVVSRDADDGEVQTFIADEALQRGEDLLVREVAGGAKEDEGVGVAGAHRPAVSSGLSFSRWPPNW